MHGKDQHSRATNYGLVTQTTARQVILYDHFHLVMQYSIRRLSVPMEKSLGCKSSPGSCLGGKNTRLLI